MPYAYTKFETDDEVFHGHGPHVGAVLLAAPILWDKSHGHQENRGPHKGAEYVRSMKATISRLVQAMEEDGRGLVHEWDVQQAPLEVADLDAGWVAFDIGTRTTEGDGWTHYARFAVLAEGDCLRVKVSVAK